MEIASRWINRDLSRLELVVALLVIAIFIGVFANHALRVFAHAERSSVLVTVTNINNALMYESAMLMRNDRQELAGLAASNPMKLMQARETGDDSAIKANMAGNVPNRYIGELSDPDLSSLEPGNWYFDLDDNSLVYLVNNDEFFISDLEGPARIIYRVKAEYVDINNNGVFDPGIDEFVSLRLENTSHHVWDL